MVRVKVIDTCAGSKGEYKSGISDKTKLTLTVDISAASFGGIHSCLNLVGNTIGVWNQMSVTFVSLTTIPSSTWRRMGSSMVSLYSFCNIGLEHLRCCIAFTISFVENIDTVRSLWNTVQRFVKDSVSKGKDHFKLKAKDSLYRFVTDERATRYNACHFWTNFEIARVDLWHTDAYKDFFDYLDADGGFFYER